MSPVKSLNLLLAFLLELVAVIGFSCIGFLIPYPTTLQSIISLLLLVCLILFWGRFMAPKAPKRVGLIAYYTIKSIIYCVAAVSIFHFYGLTLVILFFFSPPLTTSFFTLTISRSKPNSIPFIEVAIALFSIALSHQSIHSKIPKYD